MTTPAYPCPHCINGLNYRSLGMPGLFRVLVSGWRYWPRNKAYIIHDKLDVVRMALKPEIVMVVVDGLCPRGGVDDYAHDWAVNGDQSLRSVIPEQHPGIYMAGRFWGPERNQHMVDLGVDYFLGFPESGSKQSGGTWDCIRRAKQVLNEDQYLITSLNV